jgi:hypothetical protein
MPEINTDRTRNKSEYQGNPYFSESQTKHLTTLYSNIETAALQTNRRRDKNQLTKTKLAHSYHSFSTLWDPAVTKVALSECTNLHITE